MPFFLEVLKYIIIFKKLKHYIPCYLFRGGWSVERALDSTPFVFFFQYKSTSNKILFYCNVAFFASCINNQWLCTLHFHFVATSKKTLMTNFKTYTQERAIQILQISRVSLLQSESKYDKYHEKENIQSRHKHPKSISICLQIAF